MAIFKRYLPIKDKENNYISVYMDYDLGGMNYFTGQAKPRGYYVVVSPCERCAKNGMVTESFTAFSGYRYTLLQVSRRSKSAEWKAKGILEDVLPQLVDQVCKKNGVVLEDGADLEVIKKVGESTKC